MLMEIMESSDANVASCGDGLERCGSSIQGSENLGDDLLEDLDSYLNDIDDRLTISRMVSDSVIKGMVSAIEQDAEMSIKTKELEVVKLKEMLQYYHVDADEIESPKSPLRLVELETDNRKIHSAVSSNLVEHDRRVESLKNLKAVAKEQFKKLKKDINNTKGYNSIRKIGSGSELVGLGGILQDKVAERCVDVNRTIDSLKSTLNNVYKQVDELVYFSKSSIEEWRQESEIQEEIEATVIRNVIQTTKERFEGRIFDQDAHFLGDVSIKCLENIKGISKLRKELDIIAKSLSVSEKSRCLNSQGSGEIFEEWNNAKRADVFHRKTSLREGNGKHESKTINPENSDGAQLNHLSKDDLISYFKTEMIRMKRNHESEVQEMTEEYFSLKREYLKEREILLTSKKDKEFDTLRKKIPEIILTLDGIIVENEKLAEITKNVDSLGSLRNRLDTLLSENRHLRGLIAENKNEIVSLTAQVSNAAERTSQHSLSEANLVKAVGNLKSAIVDTQIKASISEEVSKCVLKGVICQIKSGNGESETESIIDEVAHDAKVACTCELEDLYIQSIITQELLVFTSREAIKDTEAKFSILEDKCINDDEIRVSLEMKILEQEKALSLKVEENERLAKDLNSLKAEMVVKEKMMLDVSVALAEVKEQFELADQECNRLKDDAIQQQLTISEITKESDAIKHRLGAALEQTDFYKMEMCKLNEKLDIAMKELRDFDDERRRMLLAVAQERQTTLLLVSEKEKQHKKQMESVITRIHGLSKAFSDFESKVSEDIKTKSSRLENISSQLNPLLKKAYILQGTALLYKQKLERRCSDLQKAEAEVDLLGDEVDVLMGLLEKICIALDHYLPILQHYPGVVEILKLVRRELNRENTDQFDNSLKKVQLLYHFLTLVSPERGCSSPCGN